MKIQSIAAAIICLGLAAIASPAHAARGFAVESVTLRAGPDITYPAIVNLPVRARLKIDGCIDGYLWCDVSWRGYRGWVDGRYLETNYNNRDLYIADVAPSIAVPVLTFDVNDYWGRYYHDRPFYAERVRYYNIHNNYPAVVHDEPRHRDELRTYRHWDNNPDHWNH